MPTVFLGSVGPLLIVLHALLALVLGGASVHQAVIATQVLRGRPLPGRLARLYSLIALGAYLMTLLSGALVYPRYRYFVRGLYLDRYAPWASNLFDFKENLATLGLPLAIGAFVLARELLPTSPAAPRGPQPGLKAVRLLYGLFALGTSLISVFNIVAGLLCTSVRGV
jgi:hypothetical protein